MDAGPVPPRRVTGRVEEGVERGARVLRTPDGRVLLLLGARREDLPIGAVVVVTGVERRGMSTPAQQGTPFLVERVEQSDG